MYFVFKQKTAYEMRISDWSSDVCSSDLSTGPIRFITRRSFSRTGRGGGKRSNGRMFVGACLGKYPWGANPWRRKLVRFWLRIRSEEHTSELQSLMRISYAVFCLKEKKPTMLTISSQHTTCMALY